MLNKISTALFRSIFFVLISLLLSQSVFAAGNVSVTRANPDPYSENKTWFFFEYTKEEAIKDSVLVKNFGREKATVKLYAVDATSNGAGSFILKFPHEEQVGIGKWARVEASALELKPGETVEVPFSVSVPENTAPGQYFGGVVVQEVSPEPELREAGENEGVIGASVNTRVGSRIHLTVPGELVTDFKWNDFSQVLQGDPLKRYFRFDFENEGNVSILPEVEIKVTNMFGREISKNVYDLGLSLPKTTIMPALEWEDPPFFGKYTVDATLSYYKQNIGSADKGSPKVLNKRLMLWVVPWLELSFVLIALILLFGFLLWRSFSIKKLKERSVWYTVKAGDNLQDLAKQHNVSWRLIAKINDLQAPYSLEEGGRILLPKND